MSGRDMTREGGEETREHEGGDGDLASLTTIVRPEEEEEEASTDGGKGERESSPHSVCVCPASSSSSQGETHRRSGPPPPPDCQRRGEGGATLAVGLEESKRAGRPYSRPRSNERIVQQGEGFSTNIDVSFN